MNQVMLFGRFTRDPELRSVQSGKAVASFSLAVNRFNGKEEADFFECTAWEKQAEAIANSCRKGHRLLIWGRLQQERWNDQEGNNRTTVKVIVSGFNFIEPPPQAQNQYAPMPQPVPGAQPPAGGYGYPPYGSGYNAPPPGANPQQPMRPPGPYAGPPAGQPVVPPNAAPSPGQQAGYAQPSQQPTGQPVYSPTGQYLGQEIPF